MQLLREVQTMMRDEAQISAARIPKSHHVHVDVQLYRLDEERQRRHWQKTIHHVFPNVQANFQEEAGHFSALETKNGGFEALYY